MTPVTAMTAFLPVEELRRLPARPGRGVCCFAELGGVIAAVADPRSTMAVTGMTLGTGSGIRPSHHGPGFDSQRLCRLVWRGLRAAASPENASNLTCTRRDG